MSSTVGLIPPPTHTDPSSSSRDAVRIASALSDGAMLERLTRMRAACQALAFELAGARRELRAAELELRRLKRRYGDC